MKFRSGNYSSNMMEISFLLQSTFQYRLLVNFFAFNCKTIEINRYIFIFLLFHRSIIYMLTAKFKRLLFDHRIYRQNSRGIYRLQKCNWKVIKSVFFPFFCNIILHNSKYILKYNTFHSIILLGWQLNVIEE